MLPHLSTSAPLALNSEIYVSDDPPSLESLTRNLSRHTRKRSSSFTEEVECCCGGKGKENGCDGGAAGSKGCRFAEKTRKMLEELEGQVQIAGTLGQALLRRHESSMVEAANREENLQSTIANLERKTLALDELNDKINAENRHLRATISDLETDLKMSDVRAREMQEALDNTHAELSRVSARAARAEVLETQLAILEGEQEELRNTIITTREEERNATARWRKSERQLADVEAQLERITHEHQMEKARSRNILERLEQQQQQHRPAGLNYSPSGSLGSTALAAVNASDKTALSVFMKEILAENGHLQVGIAELRELLAQSQEEINTLRAQLDSVPPPSTASSSGVGMRPMPAPLSVEMERTHTGSVQTVVHHHHYHNAPPNPAKEKMGVRSSSIRRGKRRVKHISSSSSDFGGSSRTSLSGLAITNSPPTTYAKRWSQMSKASINSSTSSAAPASTSSYLTSPTSTYHEPSIFENWTESSRPTSADGSEAGFMSPGPNYKRSLRFPKSSPLPLTFEEPPSSPPRPSSPPTFSTPNRLRRTQSLESILSIVEPPQMSSTNSTKSTASTISHHLPLPLPFPLSSTTTSTTSSATSLHPSRRPPLVTQSSGGYDPLASVTPNIAIGNRSIRGKRPSDSAYSRLLGLHNHGSSSNLTSTSTSPQEADGRQITMGVKRVVTDGLGSLAAAPGQWFWKWGSTVAESRTAPTPPSSHPSSPPPIPEDPDTGFKDFTKSKMAAGAGAGGIRGGIVGDLIGGRIGGRSGSEGGGSGNGKGVTGGGDRRRPNGMGMGGRTESAPAVIRKSPVVVMQAGVEELREALGEE